MGPKIFASNYSKWTLSFGAVRNLRKQPTCFFKFLWSLMLVSMISAFIAHTVFIVWGYLQYPTSSSLKYVYSSSMPFPAVTFMKGYNYILSKRQKQLRVNEDSKPHQSRKKRAVCSVELKTNQYDSSYVYTKKYCNNVTDIVLQCPNASSIMNLAFPYPLQPQHQKIIDATFAYCLSQYTCGVADACSTFESTMNVLNSINSCLSDQGLISDLGYPPTSTIGNPANQMSEQIGLSCKEFPDSGYNVAFFQKPTMNGTYSYASKKSVGSERFNATIENCDRTGSYNISFAITCPKIPDVEYVISEILTPMSTYECGKKCLSMPCPYPLIPGPCGNSDYHSLMCSFAVCSTSTLMWTEPSSTIFTPELSTSTSIILTTPIELTTSEADTTFKNSFSSLSSISFQKTKIPTSELTTSTEFPTSTEILTSMSEIEESTTILSFPAISSTEIELTTSKSDTTMIRLTSTEFLTSSPLESTTVSSLTPGTELSYNRSSMTSTEIDSATSLSTNTQSSTFEDSSTSLLSTSSPTVPESTTIFSWSSSIQPDTTTLLSSTIQYSTPENSSKIETVLESTTIPSSTLSAESSTIDSSTASSTKIDSTTKVMTSQSVTQTSPIIQSSLHTSTSTSIYQNPTTFQPSSTQISRTSHESTIQTSISSGPHQTTGKSSSFTPTSSKSPSATQTNLYTSESTQQSIMYFSDHSSSLSINLPTSTSPNVQSSLSTASNQTTVQSIPTSLFSADNLFSSGTASKSSTAQTSPTVQSSSDSSNQATVKSSTTKTPPISVVDVIIPSTKTSDSTIISTVMSSTKISYPDTTQTSFSSTLSSFKSLSPSNTTHLPPKYSNSEMTDQEVASLWNLNDNLNQPSLVAHVRESLIEISATLSPEERQQLFYSLPELVSSCKLGNTPCDMDNDFVQMFDVDYGYCYTYNPKMPIGVHNITRSGRNHGLRMVLFTNPITYMNTTESIGFKIAVHPQELDPFPNTQGYFGEVGRSIDIVLSEKRYVRLNKPYGNCDTSETLKARGQPFFFNGSYTMEGCFRSCFQEKMVNVCGCADPRFPHTEQVKLCTHDNATNHKCNQNYIKNNGDYYFVNCTCYNPCSETEFKTELWRGKWPSGDFFSEQYCPAAQLVNQDCKKYYFDNSAEIFVYYDRLSHSILERSPSNRVVDLISGIGNSSYTWIGCSLFTLTEILLITIQSLLWCFCCRFELPEVPSCHRSQNSIKDEEEESKDCNNPSGFTDNNYPALNSNNPWNESEVNFVIGSKKKDNLPESQLIYRHLVSKRDGDNLLPIPVRFTVTEMPPFVENMK